MSGPESVGVGGSARIRIWPHQPAKDGEASEYAELVGEVTIRPAPASDEAAPVGRRVNEESQIAPGYRPPPVTPAFAAKVRSRIDAVVTEHMPPLQSIDVLGLSVEWLAKHEFNPHLPQGALSFSHFIGPVQSALLTVLRVHPALARDAGMSFGQGEDTSPESFSAALGKFYAWAKSVLGSLVREFNSCNRALTAERREDLIVLLYGQIVESAPIRGDQQQFRNSLLYALGDTIGERRDGLDVLENGAFREWINVLCGDTERPRTLLKREGDALALDLRATRRAAERLLGKGERKSEKMAASLDRPLSDGDTSLEMSCAQTREASSDDWIAFRELRDLRDALDGHRLLQEAVDAIRDCCPLGAAGYAESLGGVAAVLGQIREPELQAAVVFSWSRGGRHGAHGAWTKQCVADEYGVTLRQIDGRLELAQEILDRERRAG